MDAPQRTRLPLSPDAEELWTSGCRDSETLLHTGKLEPERSAPKRARMDMESSSSALFASSVPDDELFVQTTFDSLTGATRQDAAARFLDMSPPLFVHIVPPSRDYEVITDPALVEELEESYVRDPDDLLRQKHPVPVCDHSVILKRGDDHQYLWALPGDQKKRVWRSGLTLSVSSIYARAKKPFAAVPASLNTARKNINEAQAGGFDIQDLILDTSDDQLFAKYGKSRVELDMQFGGFTGEAVRAVWSAMGRTASALGTIMHAHIERFYNLKMFPAADQLPADAQAFLRDRTWPQGKVRSPALRALLRLNGLEEDQTPQLELAQPLVPFPSADQFPADVQAFLESRWPEGTPSPAFRALLALNNLPEEPTPEFLEFLRFSRLPEHSRAMVFRTEMTMFFPPLLMTGQADAFFRVSADGPDGEVDLYDWKRIKDTAKNETFAPEFRAAFPQTRCPQTNVGMYFLQLNLYRFLAERAGMRVRNMYLCVFYPGRPFEKIPVPLLADECIWLLERQEEYVKELERLYSPASV